MIEGNTKMNDDSIIKVAIIGSGLAGLHAAHLLSETIELRNRFNVHLFEANDQFGLDGSSISIDNVRIDVPLRSFNAGYYPGLMKLYKKLGVSIRKANFTFSFATYTQLHSPFFLYNGHSGLRGISIPSHPPTRNSFSTLLLHLQVLIIFIASYFCLLILTLYHSLLGHLQNPSHSLSSEPLASWLSRHTTLINPVFAENVLIPLFSAMTTSSFAQVQQLPTAEVLLYISSTFLQSHYTVSHGVGEAQARLISELPAQNIHLATPIHKVVATGSNSEDRATTSLISLDTKTKTSMGYDGFHHVIFATPANLSVSLLKTYQESLSSSDNKASSKKEVVRIQKLQDQLEQVKYTTSTVVNHTDVSLLPRNQKDWRDLNLVLPSRDSTSTLKVKSADYTMATHLCHRSKDGKFIFQTTNPLESPSPSSVLSSSTFSRALTLGKGQLQGLFKWKRRRRNSWQMELGSLHQETAGNLPRLWFCGSYSQGIPLLEGCITSSNLVVAAIQQEAH